MKHSLKISLMALVAMFAFNTVADAQFGALKKLAKSAGGKSQALKEIEAFVEEHKAAIPQPKQGNPVDFSLEWEIGFEHKSGVVATCDPAKLEVTIKTDRNGNKPGTVVKLDPNTGKWTDASGASKGSISADGTIDSPGFGIVKLEENKEHCMDAENKIDTDILMGYNIKLGRDNTKLTYYQFNDLRGRSMTKENVGKIKWGVNKGEVSDKTINPLIVAYVYFGLIFNQNDVLTNKLGYDITKTFTESELRNSVTYKDEAAVAQIKKIEDGFLNYNSATKGGKIAEIGLMTRWLHETGYKNRYKWNETTYTIDRLNYWVVYEMPDGKNKVAFYQLVKNDGDRGVTERSKCKGMHTLTEWKRK